MLNEWGVKYGIKSETTVPYTSHQNGLVERSIQTTHIAVKAILDDGHLPISFWDEAVRANAYLRNRTAKGPIIDDAMTCPEQAYSSVKPSIDHIRVWGCLCFTHVSPDSLPRGTKGLSLNNTGRDAVLVGFDDNTTKQYRVYAPDLGKYVKASSVTFDESIRGGDITGGLKIRGDANGPEGTPTGQPVRNPVGRPKMVEEQAPPPPAPFAPPAPIPTETPAEPAPPRESIPADTPIAPIAPEMTPPVVTPPEQTPSIP